MPKKILIADDDQNHLTMIAEMLKTRGYDVVVAHDGEQAVERVTRLKPDLAIFDVQMPKMDGDQAAMILKGAAETKRIPILFVTGLRTEKEIEETGEEDILAKPVQMQMLLDKVAKMTADGPAAA